RIPIVHIAGGEISEGAVDDSIRHAITKMSALHLVATEPYRRRVIGMGEEPSRVINTGAIGVYNIMHEPLMSLDELESSIGMRLGDKALLVTYHPVTLDTPGFTPTMRVEALLDAISRFPDRKVIITYPNNDPAGREIIPLIEAYGRENPDRVRVIPSLGKRRYLSALKYVGAVVGNSSSGIVEVPSMRIPTVNVGIRQRGRLASQSVINCGDTPDEIASAISYALSDEGQQMARRAENPYARPDTLGVMVKAIAETPLETLHNKKFYDGI
ncbi:MAG: UDP-N-acetylglucosamine 2-epimerase (hydrolyzing), partial [Duncaniella sp.]|nr:UDP-N-acetylglucosamine 2-epimerase (hydrolyzing) [Duncaniella sp.]